MLVHDQPLAILFFEDGGPAEITHVVLARLVGHVEGHRRGNPVNVSTLVNLDVVIHRAARGIEVLEDLGNPGLIVIPPAILQGAMSKNTCGPWA